MRSVFRSSRLHPAVLGLFCALGLAFGGPVLAQEQTDLAPIYTEIRIPVPNVDTVPGSTLDKRVEYFTEGKVEDLAQYLGIVYNFLISIVGLLASVMMIIGGFQYLTSAGDSGKISAAKSRMANAFIGMILALGAYTVLVSINPALVVLKKPGVKDVSAKLTFLPWCDEVAAAGKKVNPIWGDPSLCGSVGEFTPGKTRLVCLYRSACPNDQSSELPGSLKNGVGMRRTCVQTLTTSAYLSEPFTNEDVLLRVDRAAKKFKYREVHGPDSIPSTTTQDGHYDPTKYNNFLKTEVWPMPNPYALMEPRPAALLKGNIRFFADCKSCIEYGAVERDPEIIAEAAGAPMPTEARCQYWQDMANGGVDFSAGAWDKRKAAGQSLLSYCRWMPEEKGCAQADFACKEPTSSSSCGNYNNIRPFYLLDTARGGFVWWIYGSDKNGTLSARPDALQSVCFSNPCGYNIDKNGCKGEGGLINGVRTAAAVVRDGIYGIQACDDK